MVKNIIITILFLMFITKLQAQNKDTLSCEKKIDRYEKLSSEYLIMMWEKYPVITKCSWHYKFIIEEQLKKLGYKEFIILSMIIDKTGVPICVKVDTKMKLVDKQYLIMEVKKLKFEPAEQNGKPVESYTPMHFPQFKETNEKDKRRIKKLFEPCN